MRDSAARRCRKGWAVGAVALLLVAGCGTSTGPERICTAEARAGIVVEVRNAATGQPEGGDAEVVATEGDFTEELESFDGLRHAGVWERPGTYTVRVEKEGFESWVREDVRVVMEPSGCHVETVQLTADLEPTEE